MRALRCLALLLALPGAAAAQQPVDRGMAVDPDVSIRIVNLAGRTVVRGWDADSVSVRGTLAPGGASFYMGGGRRGVKVGVENPAEAGATKESTLEVRVPHGARVWVKGATAGITVEGVSGEVDVSSVSGTVSVSGTPSLLTAESMDGDVDVTARARVTRVRTAGGDVTLRGAAGDVSVTSVSGTIRLLESDVAVGRIESVSGAVTFRGAVAKGGTLDLQTHDAPIELTLAQGQGAVVDVAAFGGTISNAIPGVVGKAVKGKPTRYEVGSGDAKISVRSLKGGVRLRRMMPRPNPS